ncbi:unnamed protein product [Trifolium pratense]|uniref:Uncharacterized protein n=1 Tax=Trifolium pratense TaxID=57577 RepID=A0ACB0LUI3_TRIPR|nr:unnamed protein product [Trifolium pratense]
MEEWNALRDQPRYSSQVGSGSSGSKRSHESDACGSNSVGSSARPIGRDAAKKKGKKKASTPTEVVDKEWDNYMKMKEKEMEHLTMVVSNQQEKNKPKKMKMYLKLSSEENLDDRKKAMLDTLAQKLERRKKILEDGAPSSRKYVNRDHPAANQRLIDDYFANEPTYDDAMFRRRYRMQKHLFLRIVGDLSSSDNYFTQRADAAKKEGISPLAKCTTTMRMLAYGIAADAVDEYIKIGGTTASECLRRFCKGIIRLYEQVYLRAPTQDDLQKILHGKTPSVNLYVNQRPYDMTYYLADGIYPSYPTFVKSIRLPQSEPDKLFAKYQEGCRKDIERAFGVLQARFKIIREPARLWDIADLSIIMRSCIILHNMIVEDERDSYAQRWTDFEQSDESGSSAPRPYSTEYYPLLQIMCVLDLSSVIKKLITNCKQI